jgi:adenylate cyclase
LASNLQAYFTMGGAMLFFFGVQNWRLFLFFFMLLLSCYLFAANFAPIDGLVLPDDKTFRDQLSTQAMINAIVMNAAVLFYALTSLRRAELDLADEHARSEALIETIMPKPIAERLKSGREERVADRIEMLSVMFADLVEFTSAVRNSPPEEVVAFLNAIVCKFDALTEIHGVEKIKTIGDSYMAAAGFTGSAKDGALAIGRFALAIREIIDAEPIFGGRKLKIRIGLHCGPVTAGVIGDTRFSYDIWGTAVNIASRMESEGLPDHIHVSETYREMVRDEFELADRGEIDVKGIGVVRTSFLLRASQLSSTAA